MNKQDYILLFHSLFPDFFENESIQNMPEEFVFDEMILSLNKFDIHSYDKFLDSSISFGFYDGDLEKLKEKVEKVDQDWGQFFSENSSIYCGYIDGKVASFCIIDDLGKHTINERVIKIGGPGCVGTLPEYRNQGIGLTMIKHVTQKLKEDGFDYSYIHFTYVASWYEKLGYRTSIRWNKNGIKT